MLHQTKIIFIIMQQSFGYLVLLVLLVIPIGCKNESKKSPTGMMEAPIQKENLKLLVGTFAEGDDQGIYQLDFNPVTGELTNSRRVAEENKPGYLYLSKDGNRVYSSNGTKPGSVSAFQWNRDRTALNKVGNLPSIGEPVMLGQVPRSIFLRPQIIVPAVSFFIPWMKKGG